ncbi:hypothetical protein lerEdw1_005831 [Lerista edwardsae]|nr:hypothetical protein lerEdw1_005831 [Lerista edwardsae]
MEQTVLFPSLLRGVSLEEQGDTPEADPCDKDLYEYYTQLKTIKLLAEGGLAPLNDRKPQVATRLQEQEGKEEADLEGYFYYHVSSLYRVLDRLTRRANAVTMRYNDIMGQINQSENTLSW